MQADVGECFLFVLLFMYIHCFFDDFDYVYTSFFLPSLMSNQIFLCFVFDVVDFSDNLETFIIFVSECIVIIISVFASDSLAIQIVISIVIL